MTDPVGRYGKGMKKAGIAIEDGTKSRIYLLGFLWRFFTANPEDPDEPVLANYAYGDLLELAACLASLGASEENKSSITRNLTQQGNTNREAHQPLCFDHRHNSVDPILSRRRKRQRPGSRHDGSLVTHPGDFIEELFVRVNDLDERITRLEDADQQVELWIRLITLISSPDILSKKWALSWICQIDWTFSKLSGTGLDLPTSIKGTASSPHPTLAAPSPPCNTKPLFATWPGSTPCLPNTACMPCRATLKAAKY